MSDQDSEVQSKSRTKFDVPWKATDAVIVFLLAWIVIPLAVLLVLSFLYHQGLYVHFVQALKAGQALPSLLFQAVCWMGTLAALVLVVRWRKGDIKDLGLRKFNWLKTLLYFTVSALVFSFVAYGALVLVSLLVPHFNANQPQDNEFIQAALDPKQRNVAFLALVIIPPVVEELIFRGFIFPAFSKKWGVVFGAITSSLLFGFAHQQGNVGVYTAVLGLLLCLLYVKLRSIIPGIFLHMLNNYLAFTALLHK